MKDFMQYKGYYSAVHFDDEELLFYGKIDFIRALITYEATNACELKKAFEETVDDYLETCSHENITPEMSFKGSFNVRLGHELHRRVALAAEKEHISLNQFITTTLAHALQ